MINYPNNKNKKNIKIQTPDISATDLMNKGLGFEEEINKTNEYYIFHNIAHIYKKPTPIKVVKVQNQKYNLSIKSKITEAYYEKKSTTDYNGIYNKYYIDFEAKETKYKTFNLKSNLHEHQKEHLINISLHGGISFLLLHMKKYSKVYLIPIEEIQKITKSILNIEEIEEIGLEVKYGLNLDYLKIVDNLIAQKEKNDSKNKTNKT